MLRFRRLVTLLAYAYPAALLAVVVALRFGGQRFWQAELGLYVPRFLFALPLPILFVTLLALRLHRVLWTQVAGIAILLFPLMGLVLPPWPRRPDEAARTLTVLSYNGNFALGGQDALADQVRGLDPDVVVFQQLFFTERLTRALQGRYPERRTDGEFFIASRFHIASTTAADPVLYAGRLRSARFIRYEIETNLGRVALYNIHPISPRYQIAAARRGGFRRGIVSGSLMSLAPRPDIESDAGLRALQVRTVASRAAQESDPVIIAGDTNLPTLSQALTPLVAYRDGFVDAGWGFGYTFPSNRPWMRIDRILASRHLRFLDFRVGTSRASDHLCVFAVLQRI